MTVDRAGSTQLDMQLRLVLLTDEHGSVGMTGTGMSSDAMWFQTDASEVGFLNTSFLLESFSVRKMAV